MNELIEQILSYLRGIWRKRWYALGCAWLVCALGWIAVFLMPNEYQSTARVYVDTQTILRPVLQGLTVDVNPNTQVDLITRTLFSRPNLEKIAQLTGLDKLAKNAEEFDRALLRLNKKIEFSKTGADLYTIAYTDKSPEPAKKMVQTVVDVFETNLVGTTQQGTDAAQRFLAEQIREYEVRLTDAENRLKEFKIKNAGRMPSEGQNYYSRRQQAVTDLGTTRLDLAQAQNRRSALQQQLNSALQQQRQDEAEAAREEQQALPQAQAQSTGDKAVVLPIDSRIQGMEQKLDELLIQFTDKHPDVNILRQSIADLKKQRQQEYAQYVASLPKTNVAAVTRTPRSTSRTPKAYSFIDELKVKLAEEDANVASLQVRLSEYERRFKELGDQSSILPQVEADLMALNRDYEANRKKYDELVSRREALRLSEQAEQSKQDVRYRIIDPPRVPLAPTGPNRLLLTAAVLGIGLALGVGLALLLSQLWPIFDNRRHLMQVTGIPVFGSVSLTLSPAAVARKRRALIAYASLGSLLLMVFAGLMLVERMRIL